MKTDVHHTLMTMTEFLQARLDLRKEPPEGGSGIVPTAVDFHKCPSGNWRCH